MKRPRRTTVPAALGGLDRAGLRAYRLLLRLYPRSFRRLYAADLEALALRQAQRARAKGRFGAARSWMRSILDVPRSAWRSWAFTHLSPSRESSMSTLWNDARFAGRTLLSSPGFTIVATLTIAIGIGSVTAMFTLVDGVLLRPLPYEQPDRLAMIWARWNELEDVQRAPVSARTVVDLRDSVSTLASVVGLWAQPGTIVDDEPQEVTVARVSTDFLSTLGIAPALGRHFQPDDDEAAILLSHALWQQRYGGDPEIVGRVIPVLGTAATVVGVLPPGHRFRIPNWAGASTVDIAIWQNMLESWIDPAEPDDSFRYIRMVGRIADGATIEQVQAELDAVAARHREESAEKADGGFHLDARPLHGELVGDVRATMLTLAGAVALVLLVACANVANLLLFRGEARRAEMGVRAALGSGRARLMRQLLTEAMVLAAMGTIVGLGIATLLVGGLTAVYPGDLPGAENVAIDLRALAVAALAAAAATMLFGLQPALRVSSLSPVSALRAAGFGDAGGRRMRRFLVVAEVAVSLVLLVAAGLLLRNFLELQSIRPGFDAEGALTFAARLDGQQAAALEARLDGLPGIHAVGSTRHLPLTGAQRALTYATRDSEAAAEPRRLGDQRFVTPGYFAAMGMRLITGTLPSTDGDARRVVVDANLARVAWNGADPVGEEILIPVFGDPDEFAWARVVGVVEHARHNNVHADSRPTVYEAMAAPNPARLRFVVRTQNDPLAAVDSVKAQLREVAAEVPMTDVRAMSDLVDESFAGSRFALLLLAVLAAVTLVLATVGLFGVLSQSVNQRLYEVGIRRALGGTRLQIGRLVVGEGMRLSLLGTIIGLGAATLSAPILRSLLVTVSAVDPPTYVALTLVLLVVAALACWLPARRAMNVDPTVALRRSA